LQTGSAYDAQIAANNPFAPVSPWGIQEIAQPLTADELMFALQQQNPMNNMVQPGYAIPPEWLQQWRNS
jgi:hypothetical protein